MSEMKLPSPKAKFENFYLGSVESLNDSCNNQRFRIAGGSVLILDVFSLGSRVDGSEKDSISCVVSDARNVTVFLTERERGESETKKKMHVETETQVSGM